MADPKSVDAGFDATALDPAIAAARDRLSKVIADVERIRGTIEPHLEEVRRRFEALLAQPDLATVDLVMQTERLVDWLERYAKVAMAFTKITDDATRLRSFVAGGADSRPDLASLSDSELANLLKKVIQPA
jgi:hypothetical protein